MISSILDIICNHSLRKLNRTLRIPGAVLCTIDVVGLSPNILHNEGLTSFRKFLESKDNKQISRDTLAELAQVVLKK